MKSYCQRIIKMTITGILVGLFSISTIYADEIIEDTISVATIEQQESQETDQPPIQVIGYSTGTHVNIRQYPNTYCQVLGQVNMNDPLIIKGKQENWYQIYYNEKEAWIFGDYVGGENLEIVPVVESVPVAPIDHQTKKEEIVQYAKQFIGTPYCYGGTTLGKGVDCSGFTQAIMKNFDITLNRSSRDQVYNGQLVDKSQLQMGDLVFFDTRGRVNQGIISHVGLYIGNGQFVHSSTNQGVVINNLNEAYYMRTYVKGVRLF